MDGWPRLGARGWIVSRCGELGSGFGLVPSSRGHYVACPGQSSSP